AAGAGGREHRRRQVDARSGAGRPVGRPPRRDGCAVVAGGVDGIGPRGVPPAPPCSDRARALGGVRELPQPCLRPGLATGRHDRLARPAPGPRARPPGSADVPTDPATGAALERQRRALGCRLHPGLAPRLGAEEPRQAPLPLPRLVRRARDRTRHHRPPPLPSGSAALAGRGLV
ncbi:MAG: Adenylate kinase, partial [uncultured Acidimicrobiales bacterium]